MSTMSICSIEDVAAAVDKPFWFQLYVMKDRGFVRSLIERAAAAKCSALVLTVDLQVLGQRHLRHQERPVGAARAQDQEPHQHGDQAGLGVQRARRQAQDLRQSRRPREGHGGRAIAGAMDRNPVRSDAELEGRGVDQEHLARQADPQGHSRRRGRQSSRPRPAPRRSWCPIMAAGSSTARRPRSRCCRRSSTRSAPRSRSCSTAASAPARTCMRALALGARAA